MLPDCRARAILFSAKYCSILRHQSVMPHSARKDRQGSLRRGIKTLGSPRRAPDVKNQRATKSRVDKTHGGTRRKQAGQVAARAKSAGQISQYHVRRSPWDLQNILKGTKTSLCKGHTVDGNAKSNASFPNKLQFEHHDRTRAASFMPASEVPSVASGAGYTSSCSLG